VRLAPRHRGFTLVELLVVVALIAMLIGLLLPALAHSRNAGRAAVCASQLRQFALTLPMYATDYRDRFFEYDWNHIYLDALRDYHENIATLRFCPVARRPRTPPGVGSAAESWVIGRGQGRSDGSYGFNGYLYATVPNDVQATFVEPRTLFPAAWWEQLSRIDFTDRVPAFADAIWIDGWPTDQDTVPPDLSRGWDDLSRDFPRHMGRFCVTRHGRAINAAFIDGHASIAPLRKLWDLQWSRVFARAEKDGV